MTTTLTCRRVGFSYGPYEALQDVDLDVRRGEIVALAGANGAGKTTLLEVVLGLRRPASGTVCLLGRDPYRERRRLAHAVGAVFQESGCAPDLTVAETVGMWRRLHRRPVGDHDPVAELNLEHRERIRVRQLSGGERRRLDLAVALIGEPDLLVLDEPTTGLDPESRVLVWDLLRHRRRKGTSVLLSTHLLEEASPHADRVEEVVR
ncbi:ABC transporter ATP-binding protein [Actinoplanes sp. NPDC051475]|uniref:ABC transporter ATP-binding protein n=1 Tax=Actinoplanes sp. NPDC051475 TaxID=3157225 RepID=UPI00344DCDEA